jgi:hypothetical protein
MAKGRAVAIVLDDVEERELTALTRKHRRAAGRSILESVSSTLNSPEWTLQLTSGMDIGSWKWGLIRTLRLKTRIPLGLMNDRP